MSSLRCHQDVCWFCYEGSRASLIRYPVIINTSWLEYQQKRSCSFLQKYTFSLLQVYNFFKLNIFFQTYKLIIYFFFSKRSLGTNALFHSVERLPFSLWAASQPAHTALNILNDMLKRVIPQVALFFFLFFFCLFFGFLIIGNAETSCVCDS